MPWRSVINVSSTLIFLFILAQFLGPASVPPGDQLSQIQAFTRPVEFDFVDWTLGALEVKLGALSLGTTDYLDLEAQSQLVLDYIDLVAQIQGAEAELANVYADPNVADPEAAAAPMRSRLDELYDERAWLAPLAENVLQSQVAATVAEMGFTLGGQALPPVMYHSTPLPWALIVSPRDAIRQDANISLETELTIEDHIALEDRISAGLDVSTLVVPVGGIGTYPTMVAQTTNFVWLTEVISHEWMHNYLTLRPLGLSYSKTSELRTMNETAASIAGTEIGRALLARFYPQLLPPPPPPVQQEEQSQPTPPPEPPAFDFNAEMRETRVMVDAMLAEGKIEEAEAYMEARRQFFWDHGYHLRKLNQAYFAFYGAYADIPGGAAGEDPVGAAVRQLWAQSTSLADFINTLAWMTSFEELQDYLAENP